jgi:hypothetical protein
MTDRTARPLPIASPTVTAITEHITKATDSAQFCWNDLRAASRNASPLEMLLLERLMEDAAKLAGSLARFRDALSDA